jgi:hypothetical protein
VSCSSVNFEESIKKMNTEREKEIRCNSDSVLKVCSVCKIKRDSFRVATYFVCAFFSLETNRAISRYQLRERERSRFLS